jgi:hypothetical protein
MPLIAPRPNLLLQVIQHRQPPSLLRIRIASSSRKAGVFGRGEYLKVNTLSYPTISINDSVSSNSRSVSPGNPTINRW